MTGMFYQIRGINAEPWAIGPLGVGRKGRATYPFIGPNQKLQAYQEALRENLQNADLVEGEVEVRLYVWRQIEHLKVSGGRDRKGKSADATNIQKATEDAIQNILIENDRNVRRISTEIVSQSEDTEPRILVHVLPYVKREIHVPAYVQDCSPGWYNSNSNPLQDMQDLAEKHLGIEDVF